MESILKTLLIVVLVYWALKLLWRVLAPFVLRWLGRRMEKMVQQTFQGDQMNEAQTTSGSNSGNANTSRSNSRSEEFGQYIDYEEID